MYNANEQAAIGIIGGADGPTAIFVSGEFPWLFVGATVLLIAAVVIGIIVAKSVKNKDE